MKNIDLDKFKKLYENSFNDCFTYDENNQLLYGKFAVKIYDLHLEEKFEELKLRIKNYKGKKIAENELNKIKLSKVIDTYNKIMNEAREQDLYSTNLLENIQKEYNRQSNGNIKDLSNVYEGLCKNIINSSIQFFIKYDKKFSLILDDFNELYSFYF